jgi:RimJ/RimL family protein N-acetyltransferase
MEKVRDMKPENITLETERLILRPLSEQDSEEVYENVKEYDIARWTINIPHPYPKEEAIRYIRQSMELIKKGKSYELAIRFNSSKELAGVMALLNVEKEHRNAELGYWIAKKYWNKGIATEAASKILEFGFQELNLERICARCFHENEASRRVMEKIGMEHEGKFRHEIFKENEFIDMIYYGMIKDDWKNHKQ